METHFVLDSHNHLVSSHKTHFSLPKGHFLFTSESVSAGHPDKLCDFISDSVLDACLEQDPHAKVYLIHILKVACESAVKNTMVMVFGEITTSAHVPYE